MRVENTKVKLTISISFDKSDKNGVVYTKEAVENAVNNLHKNIPIIYGDVKTNKNIIGATTGDSHIVIWDFENQICKMVVDGVIFYSGAEIIVNEMNNNKITDFEIVNIGLSK